MEIFCQDPFKNSKLFQIFNEDVNFISSFIRNNKSEINLLNEIGMSSKRVQDFLKDIILSRGYKYEEKQDLFKPDYIKLCKTGGIMIEVERGKTINNNMDLLDFWKCHISSKFNCLILIVPDKVPRKKASFSIYNLVVRRMKPLFDKRNYSNVMALAIINY